MSLNLKAVISADGSQFEATMRKMRDSASKASVSIADSFKSKIAAAFAVGVVVDRAIALTKHVSNYVGRIKDAADQTGMTTDQIQILSAAARDAGLDFNNLSTAISKFGELRKNALGGDSDAISKLAKVGIGMGDIQNPSFNEYDFIERMKGMEITPVVRAELRDMFGNKIGDKLPLVASGMDAAKNEQMVSEADTKKVDAATKKVEKAGNLLTVLAARFLVDRLDNSPGGMLFQWATGMKEDEKKETPKTPPPISLQGLNSNFQSNQRIQAAKDLLEIQQKILLMNQKTLTVDEERAKQIKEIRSLLEQISSLEGYKGAINKNVGTAESKMNFAVVEFERLKSQGATQEQLKAQQAKVFESREAFRLAQDGQALWKSDAAKANFGAFEQSSNLLKNLQGSPQNQGISAVDRQLQLSLVREIKRLTDRLSKLGFNHTEPFDGR